MFILSLSPRLNKVYWHMKCNEDLALRNPQSMAGNIFLEGGAYGKPALDEVKNVWN
jgi:hypothetical protein